MATAAPDLIEIVRRSTGYLRDRGSESPRLDAELLVAHALGLSRIDLYLQHDRPLGEAELQAVRELVRRRAGGEPVAYIVGTREFYGRAFEVSPAVLIPRPETELLVERALRAARDLGRAARIADLGTGSGCLAVTLAAELGEGRVIATEISEAALAVAGANARRHGVAERVELRRASWAEGLGGGLDIVVSNPPYVTAAEMAELDAGVADHEPHLALAGGADGLASYRELLESLMEPPGWIGLEVDVRRSADVAELLRRRWPGSEVTTSGDLSGRPRVVETIPIQVAAG